MFDDKVDQHRQRLCCIRVSLKVQEFNAGKKRVDVEDTGKEFILILYFKTFCIERVVERLEFQIVYDPLFVYLFTVKRDDDF